MSKQVTASGSATSIIFGIILIIMAYWIDGNPDNQIIKDYGLKAVSGIMFWIGFVLIMLPVIILIIVFGIIGIAALRD